MKETFILLWQNIQESFSQLIFFIFGEIDFSVFTSFQIITDILFLSIIFFLILRFILKIRAFQILGGFAMLAVIFLISYSLELQSTQTLIKWMFITFIVTIPLLFHHELRHSFDKLFYTPGFFFQKSHVSLKHKIIKSIKQASQTLAEKHHGGTIVIEQQSPLRSYIDTGIAIHAEISKELLLNIFFPKSPLHDGAVIIRKQYIVSAGSVLPLSYLNTEKQYGTRHKSALGLSEVSDAIIIVISEERGCMSIVHNGNFLQNVSEDYLEHYLEEHLKV